MAYLPLCIGDYCMEKFKEKEAEVKELECFRFGEINFQRYDSRGIFSQHYKSIKYGWSYTPNIDRDEDKVKSFCNATK